MRILHYYVDQAMAELDLTSVKRIAIDETSSHRGHRYTTLFVDADAKIVLFATEGKAMDTLGRFKELAAKGACAEQIKGRLLRYVSGVRVHTRHRGLPSPSPDYVR